MPTLTQQETNRGLLAILGYRLNHADYFASAVREYRGWCRGMQRATGKCFPRTPKQQRVLYMGKLAETLASQQAPALKRLAVS